MESENGGSDCSSDDNWQVAKSRKRYNDESPKEQCKRRITINDPCTNCKMFQLLENNLGDYNENEKNS